MSWVEPGPSVPGLAAKYEMPGMLPARSDPAVTVSAVAASDDSGEKSRSSLEPAPSGNAGAPGHTPITGVAGSSAARASVSMAGEPGDHRLPAVVIAATAAAVPRPNRAAVRLDKLVRSSRRRAASRRRARSVDPVSGAGSVDSTAGCGVGVLCSL